MPATQADRCGCRERARAGADLAVTPELALVGYLPRDLLLSANFVDQSWVDLDELCARTRGWPPTLVGLPERIPPTKDGRSSTAPRCFAPGASSRIPQGAAAHLRRLRRGPLLRAVPRRADPRARRHAHRHQHLRRHLERSRLLEAPPLITTIRSRSWSARAPRAS
jgi:hypothetical protein